MLNVVLDERSNDESIDSLEGCRSGKNTTNPLRHRSGGLLTILTGSGFIVHLTENVHRETPTEVIIETVKAHTKKESHIEYFERCEAVACDNMCNLLERVYSLGKQGLLTNNQIYFWNEMKCRSCVDRFHISTHKCKLCSIESEFCVLHPKLKKFREVLRQKENDVNDAVK